jgi:hypothetical protein
MRRHVVTALVLAGLTAAPAVARGQGASQDERKAVAALGQATPPTAFAIDVNAVSTPLPGLLGRSAVFVRVPGGSLSFTPETKTGMFDAGALVLVRFVGADGVVIGQASYTFPIRGLLADAKQGVSKAIEYSHLFDLPPGATCTLQVVVLDQANKSASVVIRPFEVPPSAYPVIGSLMVLDRADKVADPAADDQSNPFVLNGIRVHPAYDAGINRGIEPEATFLLPIVLAPGAPAPGLSLSLLQSGVTRATVALSGVAPKPDGRMMTVGRLPLARVPPGTYDLLVTIASGEHTTMRKTSMTVVD